MANWFHISFIHRIPAFRFVSVHYKKLVYRWQLMINSKAKNVTKFCRSHNDNKLQNSNPQNSNDYTVVLFWAPVNPALNQHFGRLSAFASHCPLRFQGRNDGARAAIPRAPNLYGDAERLRGAPKNLNNVTSTFFSKVLLLPKDLRFEHGGAKLASCTGRHLTSLRPCRQCFSWF